MWFRWEHHAVGWCSEVQHLERPKDSERYTPAVEVPPDCIGEDGEPMFGRLEARFPKPVEAME